MKSKCFCLLFIDLFSSPVRMSWNVGDKRNLGLKLKSKLGFCHVVLTTPKTSPRKLTLTVVENQRLADIKRLIAKMKPCQKWTIYSGTRKVCVEFQTDTQTEFCRVPLPKQLKPQRQNSWSENVKIPVALGKTSLSIELYWHILQSMCCTGWNNFSYIKHTLSRMDVLFLVSNFPLYPGLKLSFQHHSVRKIFFPSACLWWDYRLSLRATDRNIKFGGAIGWGESYLKFSFRLSKVFTLHAKLLDAVGALGTRSGKKLGYCWMTGRGPNSCLLDHVTGLPPLPLRKTILPSIFNSIDFWSSNSCIASDIELEDISVIRELGVFLMGLFRYNHFALRKTTNPQNQQIGVQEHCLELCGAVEVWIKVSFSTFFPEM